VVPGALVETTRSPLDRVETSVQYLKGKFSDLKTLQITANEINEYYRLGQRAASATVNRELAALKRMFNIGTRQTPTIIDRVPQIAIFKERNARKGFFEHWEFLALRDALSGCLKGFVTFAYKYGWRLEEICSLKWSQVNRAQGIVRLEVG
jgi:integrase